MLKTRVLPLAVLFAAIFATVAFAQNDGGRIVRSKFVSGSGGFTIDLPNKTDDSIQPISGLTEGASTYTWRNEHGSFTIGYVDGVSGSPVDRFAVLGQLADAVTTSQRDLSGRVVDRCPFSFGGWAGIELKIERQNGSLAIDRFILVGRRLYVLTADWKSDDLEADPRRILDSFDLIDTQSLNG